MPRLLIAVLALALVVVGCGSGDGAPLGSPDPAAATVTQGRFSLHFAIDRSTVRPTDAITGTATLSLLGPTGATVTGSSALFGFDFTEVGGNHRHVEPVFTADCAPHRLTTNGPLDSPIVKSGAFVQGADADWYRQFLQDPIVKLPAGDWDITAVSGFVDGQACSGQQINLRATVRVHVTGG